MSGLPAVCFPASSGGGNRLCPRKGFSERRRSGRPAGPVQLRVARVAVTDQRERERERVCVCVCQSVYVCVCVCV